MHLARKEARFIHEGSRTREVFLTCRKQRLPLNVKVIPSWLKRAGLSQKREIRIVNLPSFGNRNALSRTTDVCHSEQPADRDGRRGP